MSTKEQWRAVIIVASILATVYWLWADTIPTAEEQHAFAMGLIFGGAVGLLPSYTNRFIAGLVVATLSVYVLVRLVG